MRRPRPGTETVARALGILAIIVLMVSVVLLIGPAFEGADEAVYPPARLLTGPAEPIPTEAAVFRTRLSDLGVGTIGDTPAAALRRRMAMYRKLRAFPGAPPRIPHGLTAEEFRLGKCNACHGRGGFVKRFGAYAPVTPHPDLSECLQCHVPDAVRVGVEFPRPRPGLACEQCHIEIGDEPSVRTALDWEPPDWPELGQRPFQGGPPFIPHDLQMRGNCLACHAGPGGTHEIRTDHPERANCRQCHIPAPSTAGPNPGPAGAAPVPAAKPSAVTGDGPGGGP